MRGPGIAACRGALPAPGSPVAAGESIRRHIPFSDGLQGRDQGPVPGLRFPLSVPARLLQATVPTSRVRRGEGRKDAQTPLRQRNGAPIAFPVPGRFQFRLVTGWNRPIALAFQPLIHCAPAGLRAGLPVKTAATSTMEKRCSSFSSSHAAPMAVFSQSRKSFCRCGGRRQIHGRACLSVLGVPGWLSTAWDNAMAFVCRPSGIAAPHAPPGRPRLKRAARSPGKRERSQRRRIQRPRRFLPARKAGVGEGRAREKRASGAE